MPEEAAKRCYIGFCTKNEDEEITMPRGKTISIVDMVAEQEALDHRDTELGEIAMHYPGLGPNNSLARQAWVSLILIKPGRKTTFHIHPQNEEFFFVIAGKGVVRERDGEEVIEHAIGANTLIVAPMGQAKQIENTGGEIMRLMQVYAPPPAAPSLQHIVENEEVSIHIEGSGRLAR